jgi:hypothetical protein
MKIGPTWPRVLLGEESPTAWDAAIVSGLIFDQKMSIGGGVDFLWNNRSKEEKISDNRFRIDSEEKTFMFPVSGYLSIAPLPDLIVNPCVSGQIGLNTMYFSHKENKMEALTPDSLLNDENGWYMGLFWKIALDAMVSIGSSTALYTGIEYQRTQPKKLGSSEDETFFYRRDMSGFGVRLGFRVIL